MLLRKSLILLCIPHNLCRFFMTHQIGQIHVTIIGPMEGVFPTPDTRPFFLSDTDIQLKINVARHRHSELATRHSTSARHWQSHYQVDARHYAKFQVDARHSDPSSWALIMARTITNSDLNRPCFAWHPYGKSGLFKTELVIYTVSLSALLTPLINEWLTQVGDVEELSTCMCVFLSSVSINSVSSVCMCLGVCQHTPDWTVCHTHLIFSGGLMIWWLHNIIIMPSYPGL